MDPQQQQQPAPTQTPTPPAPAAVTSPPLQPETPTPTPVKTGRKKFRDMTHEELGKRITIVGQILFWLSIVAVALLVLLTFFQNGGAATTIPQEDSVYIVLYALQALIGLGLVKRNIIAYYAFRVIGILVFISLLIVLVMVPVFLLSLFAIGGLPSEAPSGLYLVILAGLLMSTMIYGAMYFFWIYGLFLTNQKKARELFHKQPPTPQQPAPPVSTPTVQ